MSNSLSLSKSLMFSVTKNVLLNNLASKHPNNNAQYTLFKEIAAISKADTSQVEEYCHILRTYDFVTRRK